MEEGRVVFLRKYKAYKVQVTSYDVWLSWVPLARCDVRYVPRLEYNLS